MNAPFCDSHQASLFRVCLMKRGMLFTSRRIGLAALLMLCVSAVPRTQTQVQPVGGESPAARMAPEVRLRKLHLVRPDLIPYPVCYEVYC